jgi:hypothetical protein
MRNLFVSLGIVLCICTMNKTMAYDFTAIYNGKTIYYNITSSTTPLTVDVTCENPYNYGENNSYIGDIVIPSTVTDNNKTYTVTGLGGFAFTQCYELTSVVIPNTVLSIKNSVFFQCRKLTSITIPNSVTSMGSDVFSQSALLTIRMTAVTPPSIELNTFDDPSNIRLHVPCGAEAAYKNATHWSDFINITDDVPLHNIYVQSNDNTMGTASIIQTNTCTNDTAIIEARSIRSPFVRWQDGNTDNPRTVIVTEDVIFIAEFEIENAIKDIEISSVAIYPNPAIDYIHVLLSDNEYQAVFTLYDVQGKVLIKQEINSQDAVWVNNLSAGIYIYHITTTKQNYQGKFIRK